MADSKPTNRERIAQIVSGIEEGIKKLFDSEKYREYLRTMSRFHSYSFNNTMLIHMQMPRATHVAGFNRWKNQFGRHVKKGERGLTIIAPTPYKKKISEIKRDPDTKAPLLDSSGQAIVEEKEVEIPLFRPVKVFDVSQTEGRPLPTLASNLTGNVQHYEAFMEALRRTSPVPMLSRPLREGLDGFFDMNSQTITLREGMGQAQTVCAAIHEMTHAILHNKKNDNESAKTADGEKEQPNPKDKNTIEIEAESVSYAVCAFWSIETGENSFGYLASWSKDKTLPELKASLETISKTADSLITEIEKHFQQVCKERGIDLSQQTELATAEKPAGLVTDVTDAPETENPTADAPAGIGLENQIASTPTAVTLENPTTDTPTDSEPLRYYVAECMEFPDMGEFHGGLSLADAIRLYEAIPEGRMNGIKGIGFQLPEDGSLYAGSDYPILEGGTIDLDMISIIDEFRENPRVWQAVESLIAAMPEAEVLGHEPTSRLVRPAPEQTAKPVQPALEETAQPKQPVPEPEKEFFRYYITQETLDHGSYPQMDGSEIHHHAHLASYENHDIQAYGYIDYPTPLSQAQIREYSLRPSGEIAVQEQERLCLLDGSIYLHIKSCKDGWDYTLYDKDSRQLHKGQLDGPDIMIPSAISRICVMHNLGSESIKSAPLFMIKVLQDNAMRQMEATAPIVQEPKPSHGNAEELHEHPGREDAAPPDTTLDQYPMPDAGRTLDELENGFGYRDSDMLPLSKDRAAELLENDFTIYAIVDGGSAEMLFDRDDLDERPADAMFTIPTAEWEASPDFHDAVMKRMERQAEREAAFLSHTMDCFAIYQIKHADPDRLRFMNMEWLESQGLTPNHANYDLIYTGELTAHKETPRQLEELYEQFNICHPADYHSPSLSVSDIIALKQGGMVSYHYCDSIGFRQLEGFLAQGNPLKNTEMAVEDDYGMIDGIINNGIKEPTVADLEAQVKAGQSISLMDLANATHRERQAKRKNKKSVMEKLMEKPPQAEPKKTAPKKSAEKER